MSKIICILYTETNGLHNTNDDVSKKNMYQFARLIALHYSIGYLENGKYIETKKVKHILKPKCIVFDPEAQKFHKITMEKAMEKGVDNSQVISELRDDLKKVKIIVSHNLPFHVRAIQTECFRTCININFPRFILIDTISFGHEYEFPKLVNLAKKLNISTDNKKQLKLIRKVFISLYKTYQKTLKVFN